MRLLILLAVLLPSAVNAQQGYRYGPPPPYMARPYEYDRPYDRRDRGWLSPDEQNFNREMRRFRRYERYNYGPNRPY